MTKRTFALLVVLAVGMAVVLSAWRPALTEEGADGGEAAAELKELQRRIAELESRVEALESRRPVITLPAQQFPQLPRRDLPEGTVEQEINGMKFYIMPLQQGDGQK
jgi:hypothetical protein